MNALHPFLPSTLQRYLSKKTETLGRQAYQMMQRSKDPYHDHTHIDRMLSDLQKFFEKSEHGQQVNPEVLLTSVLWHDTWKSGRLAKNLLELLHHQWMDGLGSAALFEHHAKAAKLERDFTKQVAYTIRKHANFQFTPVRTLEAKVLRDIDDLDLWSTQRLQLGQGLFIFQSPWKVKVFRDLLEKQSLHTKWAIAERELRRSGLLREIESIINDFAH